MRPPIRVMVVDDSAFMRKILRNLIEEHEELTVVGTALDGEFALRKLGELNPDIITLDVEMPRMDGIETLLQIRTVSDVPVLMVSSHTQAGAEITLKALDSGATDFVAKPAGSQAMELLRKDLLPRLVALGRRSQVRRGVITVRTQPESRPSPKLSPAPVSIPSSSSHRRLPGGDGIPVIAIGISTGGPRALTEFLPKLPADLNAAVLVVQHMPESFTGPFAERLDRACAMEVKEAADGDPLKSGQILIARGDHHLVLEHRSSGPIIRLTQTENISGHRPSADVLFQSVSRVMGTRCIGILMTGMGQDGADGLGMIQAAGGCTMAQDEASSTIFGMNRVAIERGFADQVVSLDQMAAAVIACLKG